MRARLSVDRKGCTRVVVLTENLVFKFPTFFSWESFLHGLLANLRERTWWQSGIAETEPLMPPTVWVSPGGWVCVQRRCRPIRHRGLFFVELAAAIATSKVAAEFWLDDCKPENFGWFEGKLVKIDLGSL